MDLIIKDDNEDRLVESRRGKLLRVTTNEVEDMVIELVKTVDEGKREADAIVPVNVDVE